MQNKKKVQIVRTLAKRNTNLQLIKKKVKESHQGLVWHPAGQVRLIITAALTFILLVRENLRT